MSYINEEKTRQFHKAAWLGDLRLVEQLSLVPQVDLNWQDSKESASPFSCACQQGHVDVVRYLLDFKDKLRRIEYNLVTVHGDTPFLRACYSGKAHVVKILLEDSRIDINRPDKYDETPLKHAADNGHLHVVKVLLAASMETIDLDKRGLKEIKRGLWSHHASGRREVGALLEAYENNPVNIRAQLRRELGYPELAPAPKGTNLAQNYESQMEKYYKSSGLKRRVGKKMDNHTPESGKFCGAAWYGDIEMVMSLAWDPRVDVNWQNFVSASPLSCACEGGHVEVVRYLLEFNDPSRPIDYNRKTDYGDTPFLRACYYGRAEVVEVLLGDARIHVHEADENGRAPLWFAAEKGWLAVAKILLALLDRVDLDRRGLGEFNTTPLEIAREKGNEDVISLLEAYERDPEKVRAQLRTEFGYPELAPASDPTPAPNASPSPVPQENEENN